MSQQTINIDANTLKDRTCVCGGFIFSNAVTLKELPPLLSPSGQIETLIAQVGFVCVLCGKTMSLRPEEPKKPKLVVVGGGG